MTPRAGRGATAEGKGRASGGIVQRPARRERGASAAARVGGKGFRRVLSYVPGVAKVLLAVGGGVLVFAGYRAAASASFFQVRGVDVSGTSRTSADEIKRVVSRAALQTGVWRADLAVISAEVERLPWVRKAVVSRVLPDGLRVRITEREPRAVVRMSNGRFVWVDEDAVTLGVMSPTDQMPPFFIRGWDESGTDGARAENRERMQKYLEMSKQWETAGLIERVSEVNLGDVRDVRANLAGDDSEIEVRLGASDFGKRLQLALKVLDEQRNTPRGAFITRLDATLEKRVIVGFSSGAQSSSAGDEDASADSTDAEILKTNERDAEKEKTTGRTRREAETGAQSARSEERKKREREKKEKKQKDTSDSQSQSRPRRVRD